MGWKGIILVAGICKYPYFMNILWKMIHFHYQRAHISLTIHWNVLIQLHTAILGTSRMIFTQFSCVYQSSPTSIFRMFNNFFSFFFLHNDGKKGVGISTLIVIICLFAQFQLLKTRCLFTYVLGMSEIMVHIVMKRYHFWAVISKYPYFMNIMMEKRVLGFLY